jgi:hypothetical protein
LAAAGDAGHTSPLESAIRDRSYTPAPKGVNKEWISDCPASAFNQDGIDSFKRVSLFHGPVGVTFLDSFPAFRYYFLALGRDEQIARGRRA